MAEEDWIIYGRLDPPCPYCDAAKALLKIKGKNFTFVDIKSDLDGQAFFQRQGWKTVPQIELWDSNNNIHHIGGYTQLKEYFNGE